MKPRTIIPRPKRHRWDEPFRDFVKTERSCLDCGLIKVTDHQNPDGSTWTAWIWRGEEIGRGSPTPQCPPRATMAAPTGENCHG